MASEPVSGGGADRKSGPINYDRLREWANGYREAEGEDQHRRALVCSLLAENERLRGPRTARAFMGNERFHVHGDIAYTVDHFSGSCYGCLLEAEHA